MSHVAFFTHNLKLGGAQRVIINLTSELADRGYYVEIVLQREQGELLEQVHNEVPVLNLDADPFLPMTQAVRSYLKERQPDVLLSTVNTANLAAILAIKTTRTGTHHVVRMANTPSKIAQGYDERLTDRPIPYLMRWLYPRADQIIAVSRGLADDLVQNYGVDRQRVKVIYNPTVTDTLIERAKGSADHPWFQDAGTEIVLGVGSLTVQKDFSTLLRAFKLVCQRRNTKLVILGEGSQRTQLEELAGRLGIEDDISLPGTVTNPYPYMAQADVFALSSRWEGCPNVLIEALACGCPVVATDCPHGPKEILEDGRYGPLVPVGDHRELAEKIRKILDTPLKKSVLRDRAMDFHVETIADEYEELLYRD